MKLQYTALALLVGCASARSLRSASYGAELEECNLTAKTCEESIACENKVRAKYPIIVDGKPTQRLPRIGGCD